MSTSFIPELGCPSLERQIFDTVEIDTREALPSDALFEHRRENLVIGVTRHTHKDAHFQTFGRGRTDGVDNLATRDAEKLDHASVEGGFYIAHVLREMASEDDLRGLVVALGRGEPLDGMVDEVRFEILEALPFKIKRPTILCLAKLYRVELLQ